MTTSSVRVDALGHEVAVHRWGHGPPQVVLVHGIGVSHRYFGPLARELAHGPDAVGVLAPDLPGFGESPRPDRPLSIPDHARVLGAVLDQVDLPGGGSVVLGHSMGAQVVTELAVQRPELVAGLVLLGPVTDPSAASAPRQALRLLRDARHETVAANLLMLSDWARCGPRWYLATVPTMVDYPTHERLAEVLAPVVLLRGARDPVTPEDFLELLAAARPGSVTEEIAGEGHIAMFRRPSVVARLCLDLRTEVV